SLHDALPISDGARGLRGLAGTASLAARLRRGPPPPHPRLGARRGDLPRRSGSRCAPPLSAAGNGAARGRAHRAGRRSVLSLSLSAAARSLTGNLDLGDDLPLSLG